MSNKRLLQLCVGFLLVTVIVVMALVYLGITD